MEKNTRSWFPNTQLQSLFPDPNLSRFTFNKSHQNVSTDFWNPLAVEDRMPYQFKASEPSNSTNWFYHMPDPRQAFAPPLSASHKQHGQHESPMTLTSSSPKRFLVFDQSGEKTTLMLTSGPIHCGMNGLPNDFSVPYSLYKEEPSGNLYPLRPLVNDGGNIVDDYFKDVAQEDDMREDTEELNALLYSDSEDYSEGDDDEASTGHSPSVMTNDRVMDLTDETGEEVDSLSKRQKLSNRDHRTTSNYIRNKSSFKTSVLGNAPESSFCDGSEHQRAQDLGSVSCGKKRPRKEKLHKTVSVLQSMIPGSNGKDALLVIDEAIRYLKSIKAKAKTLGLDAL